MINRWQWALACAVSSLLLLFCGLLVPAYLRAVDVNVIQRAGRDTPALTAQGLSLVNQQNLGTAWLFFQAAQAEGISGRENLGLAVTNAMRQHPDWLAWGNDSALKRLFGNDSPSPEPFTGFIVRQKNREAALDLLRASTSPTVQELLRCRALTGTTLFTPSQSASGQAFDVAVTTCGLLVEEGRLTTGLGDNIFKLASAANRGGSSQPLEQVLMDLMSLGRRFSWDQLVAFTGRIEDAGTLHVLADQVRDADGQLPVLFSAVALSGKPAAVARYVTHFPQTGLTDLGYSLRFGAGGVNELLARDQLLYRTGSRHAPGSGVQPAAAVAGVHAEMAGLPGEWISSGRVAAFCAAGRIVPGTTVAGARVPCGPREFVCVGFPAGGVASERAVSRPGHTERGVSPFDCTCPRRARWSWPDSPAIIPTL